MAHDKVDLVYVLGSGSVWSNNEIRYSLRSVQKNLKGVRNIYVIGVNPGIFTDNIRHIYFPDELRQNADGNMARKIIRACQEEDLSDDFLFMNDDFIIHKPMTAPEIPWLDKGDMSKRPSAYWNNTLYRKRLCRTFEVLRDRGLPTLQYDYHAPMLMNKHEFPKLMSQFDYESGIGYTFRSLYGNCMRLPSVHLEGQKVTVYKSYDMPSLEQHVRDAWFVGFNDAGLNGTLKIWLKLMFPHPSEYEQPTFDSTRSEAVAEWYKRGCNYNEGVALFEQFCPKNRTFIKYLQTRHNAISEKRLKISLQTWLH